MVSRPGLAVSVLSGAGAGPVPTVLAAKPDGWIGLVAVGKPFLLLAAASLALCFASASTPSASNLHALPSARAQV